MVFPDILIVTVLGMVLGSFATALVYRVPRGISWSFRNKNSASDITHKYSACPHCKTRLGVPDLVPIFSWLFSMGCCRHCQKAIGTVYPLTELGTVLACLAVYFVFGLGFSGIVLLMIVPFLAALLIIDLRHMILPNELVFIIGFLGMFRHLGEWLFSGIADMGVIIVEYGIGAILYAVLAWAPGYIMTNILKKEALGFGDVKFFAVAGLWLGLSYIGWFYILSGFLGIVFSFVWQVIVKERVFPFGPALIVSLYGLLLLQGSHFF